jgi:hypothetical protein
MGWKLLMPAGRRRPRATGASSLAPGSTEATKEFLASSCFWAGSGDMLNILLNTRSMTALYNLIIFHVPEHQQVSDFETIRDMMRRQAPDIEVHIVTTDATPAESFWRGSLWQKVAARPTVFFSPLAIRVPEPIRGARLTSIQVSKWMELRTMARAGIPVPETRIITPDLRLDEASWGPFTVIKPNGGYQGRGVHLVRTRDVRWIDTSTLPKDDPRHGQKLLAQRFIDTGRSSNCYRVFTVLGHHIYCIVSKAVETQILPNAKEEVEVATNGGGRTIEVVEESDVIDLAKAVHAAKPRLPVMGVDIVRESKTGKLFALEYNSGGYIWHLSSDHGLKYQRDYDLDLYGQFALPTISRALIDATRTWAA